MVCTLTSVANNSTQLDADYTKPDYSDFNYTITICVAERGTETIKGNESLFGHMWFELDDGKGGFFSYGWGPVVDGAPLTTGVISKNDHIYYLGDYYSRTIPITSEQYAAMKNFGGNPSTYGFSIGYNGLTNSCIDFVWKALEAGNLNPGKFEGDLMPSWNINNVNNIVNPCVDSDAEHDIDPGIDFGIDLDIDSDIDSDTNTDTNTDTNPGINPGINPDIDPSPPLGSIGNPIELPEIIIYPKGDYFLDVEHDVNHYLNSDNNSNDLDANSDADINFDNGNVEPDPDPEPYTDPDANPVNCLAAGTLIRTPSGNRPVEELQIGDLVLTHDGPLPLKFLGISSRHVNSLKASGRMPIRIQALVFGHNLPSADIYCTPSHAFALGDCLVEAQALINGQSIYQLEQLSEYDQRHQCEQHSSLAEQEEADSFTYYSLEFNQHVLVWANDLLTESYLPTYRDGELTRVAWNNYYNYISLYGSSETMDELPMPRIPFSRQLPQRIREKFGLVSSNGPSSAGISGSSASGSGASRDELCLTL